MAMGTRKQRERQEDIWIAHTELTSAPAHPFYQRLNELLEAEGLDEFVESRCAKFYAAKNGRPSLTPGIYFRSLLIGGDAARRGSGRHYNPGYHAERGGPGGGRADRTRSRAAARRQAQGQRPGHRRGGGRQGLP